MGRSPRERMVPSRRNGAMPGKVPRLAATPGTARNPRRGGVSSLLAGTDPGGGMAMDYRDKQVIVTGGTGALGSAVVGALLEAGARCHVPYIDEGEAERFPYHRHERVTLSADASLADEAAVTRLYDGIAPLWASIHIAG